MAANEDKNLGLADAIEGFWDNCKAGDFEKAADEFRDMQRLADDDMATDAGDEKKGSEEHGKPLAGLLVIGKKK